jgi:hypothetical protein
LRILTGQEKLSPLKLSVNMGGWYGGLPYKVCRGRGWAAYDVQLDPRQMNVIRWGFPEKDTPPGATMWLLRRWRLQASRVTVSFQPSGDGSPKPELPTPFAGMVSSAVNVTAITDQITVNGKPWTD